MKIDISNIVDEFLEFFAHKIHLWIICCLLSVNCFTRYTRCLLAHPLCTVQESSVATHFVDVYTTICFLMCLYFVVRQIIQREIMTINYNVEHLLQTAIGLQYEHVIASRFILFIRILRDASTAIVILNCA
jgi:hypothetical protein